MRQRVMRTGMWVSLVLSVLLGGALALSFARPTWAGRGGSVIGVTSGRIEFARSSGTLARQGVAWGMGSSQGYASVLVAPGSVWRPTTSEATVGMGAPSATLTLWVAYVPLWPWLALSAGATGLLWRAAWTKVVPGHCRECGYDLRGLSGEKCPECGAVTGSIFARLLIVVRRLTAESQRTQRVEHGL